MLKVETFRQKLGKTGHYLSHASTEPTDAPMHRRKANSHTETWNFALIICLSALATLAGMQNLYSYSRLTSTLILEVWSPR